LMLVAICTNASLLIRRVSVIGGMSTIRRSKPGGRFCPPGAGAGCCPRCCFWGGKRAPPGLVSVTGPGVSAGSCVGPVPTRLLRSGTDRGRDGKRAGGGTVAVDGGRMGVLMTPQRGSLQPAMLVGTAGGLETTPPVTVLLAPGLVTTPEPVEFVMVPVLVP